MDDAMQIIEGELTYDVLLSFHEQNDGKRFARISEASGDCDIIDLDQFQAVAVAKEILKKYEPKALK